MVKVQFKYKTETKTVEVAEHTKLADAVRVTGFYTLMPCGGNGRCGKCKMKVLAGDVKISNADVTHFSKEELASGMRLLCTAEALADTEIELSPTDESKFAAIINYVSNAHEINSVEVREVELLRNEISIANKIRGDKKELKIPYSILKKCSELVDTAKTVWVASDSERVLQVSPSAKEFYGVAIDIGTTTIGFALVNLTSGEVFANYSGINKQREYGADVISRIEYASDGGLNTLSKCIKEQIVFGIGEVCKKNNVAQEDIVKVSIAGNTTMLHLLINVSCEGLGVTPFTPITLDLMKCRFNDVFDSTLDARLEILSGISAYVGADITAGILSVDLHKSQTPKFLLDIGTNGEMALCVSGKLLCTSTAAGPAFEGGNIHHGTGSIPGAISSVKYIDGKFEVNTIANEPPIGICGSGLIDAVAECLEHGLIDETGRFAKEYRGTNIVLATGTSGEEIVLTQKDIRELQSGKSAIRSGLDCLIARANIEYKDIDKLYVAGGFGFKVNFDNAVKIGLIPTELREKIELIGNSSLGGAIRYLLDASSEYEIRDITNRAILHELAHDRNFDTAFIENMIF